MMLYFAYGSNMSRAAMRLRCPGARALGVARLDDHAFFIGVDGWASVRRRPGCVVHGVLWRLTLRDLATLHAYELLHQGLYDMRTVTVRAEAAHMRVMTYVLRRRGQGRARPAYIGPIVDAARAWRFPPCYGAALARWASSRLPASPITGEVA